MDQNPSSIITPICKNTIEQINTSSSSPLALETNELYKTFKGFCAVDHLSLTVQQGEIFGLLGPNGSGKTTTINMISGLWPPNSGWVKIMGINVCHQSQHVRQLLGCVPQETALYEELTAWQNMDFHADLFGIPLRDKNKRITYMLDLVQLLDRKNSHVNTFSGGMKRRLALARALLHEPKLIYLDEPTLGVDVHSKRAIWDYILSLKEQGKTILLTTNYLEEAQALCDRIAIIDHGKLIAVDTPEHLKQKYGGSVIEVETSQSTTKIDQLQALFGIKEVAQNGRHLKITALGIQNIAAQIINILSQEGDINSISVREPNLDDIFLHLTGTALRD